MRNIKVNELKEEEKKQEKQDEIDEMLNPNRGLFNDVSDDEEEEQDKKKFKYPSKIDAISSAGLSKISKEEVDQTRLFPDPDLENLRLKDKKKRKRENMSPKLSKKFLQQTNNTPRVATNSSHEQEVQTPLNK